MVEKSVERKRNRALVQYTIIVRADGTKVRRVLRKGLDATEPKAQYNLGHSPPSIQNSSTSSSSSVRTTWEDQYNVATMLTNTTLESHIDFTKIPRLLDSAMEEFACGTTLRSTTLQLSDSWQRIRQQNLLKKPRTSILNSTCIKTEKMAMTHCFEKDVIDTVVQDNINPIEKLEMSTLLLGSTIYGVPACTLVRGEIDVHRLQTTYPALLAN